MPASSLALQPRPLVRRSYRRRQSLPHRSPPRDVAGAVAPQDDHQEQQVVRTRSCDLSEPCRFRIAYSDDKLRSTALANMNRLIRAAQQPEQSATEKDVLLVKKALRYRNLLAHAQEVDIDDPAFDITHFLKIKWHKVESKGDDLTSKYPSNK